MILAGDVGATKTLLGLFEPTATRPIPHRIESYITADFDGLPSMVRAYLATWPSPPSIEAASFGVAGPIIDQRVQMTNVSWAIDAAEVGRVLNIPRVRLFNDLEAMAYGVTVLTPDEVHTLQEGQARRDGNAVLLAAGTGMGQAILHRLDGRWYPMATEGGHVEFASRTEREWALVQFLHRRQDRVDLEHVVSGLGLLNIAQFTHDGEVCPTVGSLTEPDTAARVSGAALNLSCPMCIEAMALFVSAYGAAAGNLAVQTLSTGGVYIGGGIAPKILPLMSDGRFLDAFLAKGHLRELVSGMPVHIILNKTVGLLGAAVAA